MSRTSFFLRLRTPTYQNTGSTARDHLASERTYLSWLRTGLGFIALGIAIERFNQLDLSTLLQSPAHQTASKAISTANSEPISESQSVDTLGSKDAGPKPKDHRLVGGLLGTGAGSIVYGTSRYFSNMRMLEKGLFKPAYFGAMGLSVAVAGVAGMVYVEALKEQMKREDENVCKGAKDWTKK